MQSCCCEATLLVLTVTLLLFCHYEGVLLFILIQLILFTSFGEVDPTPVSHSTQNEEKELIQAVAHFSYEFLLTSNAATETGKTAQIPSTNPCIFLCSPFVLILFKIQMRSNQSDYYFVLQNSLFLVSHGYSYIFPNLS